MNISTIFCFLIWVLLPVSTLFADDSNNNAPLYIVFDGSNSMWGELADKSRKIEVAKQVFNNLDAKTFAGREIALRLYGHRRRSDCSDTELAVPFGPSDEALALVSKQINTVTPRGKTPITRSLKAALDDMGDRGGEILLISDGIETCDTDPCELIESWRDQNINIRVHVVGFGLDELSRSAMECIANASGTKYLDAHNAEELTQAIETTADSDPLLADEPQPRAQTTGPAFKIKGNDQNGLYVPVLGTLSSSEMESVKITSNARHVFPGGDYSINVGVPTVNGELYKPITKDIVVKEQGTTTIEVSLERPPVIRTRFIEKGKEIRGTITKVFQDGENHFNLRAAEDYFILPGNYEFRSKLNKDNSLSITETVNKHDDKTIEFILVETVRAQFVVKPDGSEKELRQHQQLYQDNVLQYKVHYANGADVKPGSYTLRSDHPLTPYQIDEIAVSSEDKQVIELNVPMASVKLNYVFLAEPKTKDRRCWLERIDSDGNKISGSKGLRCNGSEIVLSAGRYRVKPWSTLGTFKSTFFTMTTGEQKQIDIQQTSTP